MNYTKGEWIRYKGKGEHSVAQLEKIIDSREELLHQEKITNQVLCSTLKVCYSALLTYGKHPIISEQVEKALKKAGYDI